MMVQQISVFLENKAGRLAEATDVLGRAGLNLRALSIADTKDFGILRLIVSDPAKAVAALEKAGFSVKTNEVIAVSVPDKPGGLHEILTVFEHLKITIEYLYAFPKISRGSAFVVIRVEDPGKAIQALQAKGVELVPPEMVYD
jgi:hypothetical protein